MPFKPLVSKIRVHNPTKKGSPTANRNYVVYIATREGVSLDNVSTINDLLNVDGMMNKELNENIIHKEADNEEYIRYMAKRPRSHGLFGNINTDNLDEIAKTVSDISKSGRIIYRGVISLGKEDGEALGFKNSEAWNQYLKKVMPDIAKELGVSVTNHTWVAAFHAEETHPHVHYELWDNNDKVKSPFIHVSTQKRCRDLLSKEMFSNEYENMIKNIYKIELDELKRTKNLSRSSILNLTEDTFKNIGYVPGVGSQILPDRIKDIEHEKLLDETNHLISLLPQSGRLTYKFLPPAAKEQLNKISSLLFERVDIQREVDTYLNTVSEMNQYYGKTKTEIKKATDDALKDIQKRVNNKILSQIKEHYIFSNTHTQMNVNEISDISNVITDELPIFVDLINSDNEVLSQNEEFVTEKNEYGYYIEWNQKYKGAMKLLYSELPDMEKVFNMLQEEAINGNVLAIQEVAKIIEKSLVDNDNLEPGEAEEYYGEALSGFKSVYLTSQNQYIKEYAAYREGKLYHYGKGTDINYEEARKWYEKAVTNVYAQYSLGKLYLDQKVDTFENCVAEDNYKKAHLLFLKSFEKVPYAAYELGNMYSKGMGVQLDNKKAENYYKIAFDKFYHIATNNTDDNIMYRVGKMLYEGKGTDKNTEKAIFFLDKSASLGNESAQYSLAMIYLESGEIEKAKKAITMLEILEQNNNQMAQYKLGCIYSNPELPFYDMQKAVFYLHKAAEQNNQFAQCKLGCMYYFGQGVNKDKELGEIWLTKAAENGNEFAADVLSKSNIDFSYALIKGVLQDLENNNRRLDNLKLETIHNHSIQAMKELYKKKDGEQKKNTDMEF